MEETREIASLARGKGVRTMIGLQSWALPALKRVNVVISKGTIGTILSTTMCRTESFLTSQMPINLAYMNTEEIGGTLLTIMGGHGKQC